MQRAARAAVFGFVGLLVFQVALAAGAPLGHAAWGGDHAHLTTAQRLGSAASVVFYVVAMVLVRGRARGRTERVYRWGTWTLAVLMSMSALMNAASGSRWENVVLAPVALALAVLCVVVAREPTAAAGAAQPALETQRRLSPGRQPIRSARPMRIPSGPRT